MKVRIKFSKEGPVRFIGHLDVMRFFQKAIRRAEIDIAYTGGYSPHQIMTFAAPLGVGLTSRGEYMDIEVNSITSCEDIKNRLNQASVPGIEIVSVNILPDNAGNAMASVAGADYEVRFREGYELEEGWKKKLEEFLALPEIRIMKETKKGEQEVDIRPWVYDYHIKDQTIFLKVSAGSVHNLKPELLLKAFGDWAGVEIPAFALLICRKEMYADEGSETERKLVALEELGEEIG